MSEQTGIEWTDATWNPTTGCTKISPGCSNCYIERTPAFRIAGRKFDAHAHIPLQLHANRLETPLHWRKPRRVFVNSLSDLFHEDVPDAFIDRVFAVMALTDQHTYQVLTKRASRMLHYLTNEQVRMRIAAQVAAIHPKSGRGIAPLDIRAWAYKRGWPLPNVWLGVSVENQHFADQRIPLLLQTPAAVRFISAEPLLGPVTLNPTWLMDMQPLSDVLSHALHAPSIPAAHRGLNWVIDGAESGAGARDYRLDWSLSLQRQCDAAGVAYFRKQVGQHPIVSDLTHWRCAATLLPDASGYRLALRHKKGGDPAEWPADLRVRQYPEGRA